MNATRACLLVLSMAFTAGAAAADDAQTTAGPSAGSSNNSDQGLQEVIVTAQKRSESIKDVPYSISAVSGDQLLQQHTQDIEDLTRAIPGVSFGSGSVQGQDNITIRGIGSQTGSAAIGLYLDDVPIVTQNPWQPGTYTGATEPHFFDMSRVEVLRGPQGTLYGASSLGGAIRYISNQPDLNDTGVTLRSDLSHTKHGGTNYDEQAIFNVALDPGVLAIRFGVDFGQDSGWINHYQFLDCDLACQAGTANSTFGALDQTAVNAQDNLVARFSALWRPTDTLSATGSIFYQRQYSQDTSVFYPFMGLWNQNKLVPERGLDEMYVGAFTLTNDFHWADLTSVSSWFVRENEKVTDGTYYNSDYIGYLLDFQFPTTMAQCPGCGAAFDDLPGPANQNQRTQTLSQEFRLTSKTEAESGRPYTWIGGLFVSDKSIGVTDNEFVTGANALFNQVYGPFGDTILNTFGVEAPGDNFGWANINEDERQYAAFGEFSYSITGSLKATVGERYVAARTYWDYGSGTGYFTEGVPSSHNHGSYTGNTPKFDLTYKLNDDVNLYAEAAKGYRIGGFVEPQSDNGFCTADFAAIGVDAAHLPLTFASDSLWNYEGGVKAALFDNRLSVNASAFYVDWKNVQQTITLPCGVPYTSNFGTAVSTGGELEIKGKVSNDLTLGLNGGTTHAYLTSVTPDSGATQGEDLLNTPSWSASSSADYSHVLPSGVRLFSRLDYDWVGPSHGSYSLDDADYNRPSYSVMNLTAGIGIGNLEVSLYGKNMLDDTKIIQHVTINALESAYTLHPLTVGLTLNWSLDKPKN
jgi:iron complex outermembrane recepter protein